MSLLLMLMLLGPPTIGIGVAIVTFRFDGKMAKEREYSSSWKIKNIMMLKWRSMCVCEKGHLRLDSLPHHHPQGGYVDIDKVEFGLLEAQEICNGTAHSLKI